MFCFGRGSEFNPQLNNPGAPGNVLEIISGNLHREAGRLMKVSRQLLLAKQ